MPGIGSPQVLFLFQAFIETVCRFSVGGFQANHSGALNPSAAEARDFFFS
jgi:hypothetical protein